VKTDQHAVLEARHNVEKTWKAIWDESPLEGMGIAASIQKSSRWTMLSIAAAAGYALGDRLRRRRVGREELQTRR
jgi:hypothetical protein